MNYVVDLYKVDEEQFYVQERGEFCLITPARTKHVWSLEERHLRSLLVRHSGEVVSSGLPKFFNYGECAEDDAEFRDALSRGAVTFSEKRDGSLIICSVIDGDLHFRTRGNHCLGEFEEPVLKLIHTKYPNLIPYLNSHSNWFRGFSLLFEYTAPDNRIVVKYEEPQLTLLGLVDLRTLELADMVHVHMLSDHVGIPVATTYELPEDFDSLMKFVKEWKDKEGVVARFMNREGTRKILLKIKATQYIRLHAIKFKLEGKVGKLLFLLGAKTALEAERALADMGVDWEAQEYIWPEVLAYVDKLHDLTVAWYFFRSQVEALSLTPLPHQTTEYPEREHRKSFVHAVRELCSTISKFADWFPAAMHIYDGKEEEAYLEVVSREILGQSALATKQWLKNPNIELASMLDVPDSED